MDINPQTEARLIDAARREGIAIDTLIERMIGEYSQHVDETHDSTQFGGRTAGDVLREIGFAEGGPSDLTTNPKYMDGFGENRNA